ncbi:MAG: 4'-phosphopantetheinyl transferase superfamily protein [Gemmatimonadetes bacterium]|nr:4'-phosphopantetheinyl transferase superfamily protein [Gemmatimonadota bacterium]NNM31532.1 4'-phosphopantetheinyl transferase superfamily protein [Gemmatimonadota bacterium]
MSETGPLRLEDRTLYIQERRLWVPDRELEALRRTLSVVELKRADRLRHERHRRRFIIAHGRLRQLLGSVTGRRPSSLRFREGAHGKPFMDEGPSFNLSHSGDRLLIGVSKAGRVGVDLEEERPVREMVALARKKFAAEEVELFLAATAADRVETFFRIWTLKEAYLKGVGTGLSTRLDSFAVAPRDAEGSAILRIDDPGETVGNWIVRNVPASEGAHAAVAIDDPDVAVEVLPFEPSA